MNIGHLGGVLNILSGKAGFLKTSKVPDSASAVARITVMQI